MKKLFLLLSFCAVANVQALTKQYLQEAITSIDVAAVEQILAHEKLTPREYHRYLDLAEEVVRNREAWVRALRRAAYAEVPRDVTTPYDNSLEGKAVAELFAGFFGMMISTACFAGAQALDKQAVIGSVGVGISIGFIVKSIYDLVRSQRLYREHEELLRKKYDNAIAIKQLIYGAEILEA